MSRAENETPLDLLAVGAHPDDVELFAGGTLAHLASLGRRIGILHLTRGECGTRGTPEIREEESRKAAVILGATRRETLDLGDGRLDTSTTNRKVVVEAIRRLRPRVVMTHYTEERHPDHRFARELVADSCFLANVAGYPAGGERHKIEELVFFVGHEGRTPVKPDWIVDTTRSHETKIAALRAFATQFHTGADDPKLPATHISSRDFWEMMEAQARLWGHAIGAQYGEAIMFARPAHSEHSFIRLFDAPR